MNRISNRWLRRGIGAGLAIVLIVVMALNTKFLTPEEVSALGPETFDPAKEAQTLFTQAQNDLTFAPADEVVPDLHTDVKAAAEKHGGISTSDTAHTFPVALDGTVSEASDSSIQVTVDGVPKETKIILPLTTAVNGTVLRDAMGFKFADAPGQTEYQYVGDEIKKLIQQQVSESVDDPAGLKGKNVQVTGLLAVQATGKAVPKPKPLNIQIVTIEVS